MQLQTEAWNHFKCEEEDVRVDSYLAKLSGLSRARVQKLIEEEKVKVNEVVVKANYKLQVGDQISLFFPEPKVLDLKPQDIPLEILFQDEHIAVINKPAGLVVHPAPGHWDGTLVNALLHHIGEDLATSSGIGGELRPGIVHRIDRNTSGILLITKTDLAHQSLSEQFRVHSISRRYLAMAWGKLPPAGEWTGAIGRDPKDRKRMAIVEKGKAARTKFRLLECFWNELSFFEAELFTGRTHQIRVHASSHGFPLVGDSLYGNSGRNKKEKGISLVKKHSEVAANCLNELYESDRQFLHAAHLGITHPVSGERLEFHADLPEDLLKIMVEIKACQK